MPAFAAREELAEAAARLRAEVARRIVGQAAVIEEILMAVMAGGHGLVVGVPGLAKTLIIRSIADAMQLEFRRIQFTPDLVPSDITGTEIMEESTATGERSFRFVRGPVFANIGADFAKVVKQLAAICPRPYRSSGPNTRSSGGGTGHQGHHDHRRGAGRPVRRLLRRDARRLVPAR